MNTQHTQVQLVISHLEGCSGNFLGKLASNKFSTDQQFFRIDYQPDDIVLALDGRNDWYKELEKIGQHEIVVTHSFDLETIHNTFPCARTIQIYPYTHIGNVLYNISHKKLITTMQNKVDNHLIHLNEWFEFLEQQRPDFECVNFWSLRNIATVEQLLGGPMTSLQQDFFQRYWQCQLNLELSIPETPMSIIELTKHWKIQDQFDHWLVAWTIFVFERINSLSEDQRRWTVSNADQYKSWIQLETIETQYKI